MTEEIWKDIPGYEGLYQASTEGRIKSLKRKNVLTDRILKQTYTNFYNCIVVSKHRKKWELVHRLVASTFLPNRDNKIQVNHKNGIKTDNRVENLEWCTARENIRHSLESGLISLGEKRSSTKLKNDQVIDIFNSNLKLKELSLKYKVSIGAIYAIKNNRSWKHITQRL